MSEKTVAQKARVRPGVRIAVVNPEPGIVESLGFVTSQAAPIPEADIVLLFVKTRAQLDESLAPTVAALASGAAVWVFYRKGSKTAGYDVNRDDVWAVAETLDLRPLGLVGIDDVWSAFRLRPAKS